MTTPADALIELERLRAERDAARTACRTSPGDARLYRVSNESRTAFYEAMESHSDTLLTALRRVVEAEVSDDEVEAALRGFYATDAGWTDSLKAGLKCALTAAKIRAGKDTPSAAASDVLAERRRQVEVEGWSPDHDDAHDRGEMARAAAAYAAHSAAFRGADQKDYRIKASHPLWPWDGSWWKPKDQRRDLVRAGALIIAEIERLDRISRAAPERQP